MTDLVMPDLDPVAALSDLLARIDPDLQLILSYRDDNPDNPRWWAAAALGDEGEYLHLVQDFAMVGDCADALAAAFINDSTCPACGLKARVLGTKAAANRSACLWGRVGRTWQNACHPTTVTAVTNPEEPTP